MALSLDEYRKKATELYDPGYASKVATAQNSADEQAANYDNQIAKLRQDYTNQLQDNSRNTLIRQNAFSNNTLNRGVARSSIATTGIAGEGDAGALIEGRLKQAQTTDINGVEAQKTALRNNLARTLQSLSDEREAGILQMIQQLRQRDEDYARSAARSSRSASSSGGYSTNDKDAVRNQFSQLMIADANGQPNANAYSWLTGNKNAIINVLGETEYNQMLKTFQNIYDNKRKQASNTRAVNLATAGAPTPAGRPVMIAE